MSYKQVVIFSFGGVILALILGIVCGILFLSLALRGID
jgi:hypothetical protein